MRIALVFFLLMAMVSCKRECTKVIDTYQNGKAKDVHVLADCSDSTTYTRLCYYENGQLSGEAQYVNGKGNGKCKSWHENGVLSAEWTEKYGLGYGVFKCYNESGKLVKEGHSEFGLREGLTKEWGDDGTLLNEANFLADMQHGRTTYYYGNGNYHIRTYQYDTLHGYTYETGFDTIKNVKWIVVGSYSNGKEDGLWKWFKDDSVLDYTKTYKQGIITGESVKYYKNGQIEFKGVLENNEFGGEWNYYDTLGNMTELRYYDKDKLIRTKKL